MIKHHGNNLIKLLSSYCCEDVAMLIDEYLCHYIVSHKNTNHIIKLTDYFSILEIDNFTNVINSPLMEEISDCDFQACVDANGKNHDSKLSHYATENLVKNFRENNSSKKVILVKFYGPHNYIVDYVVLPNYKICYVYYYNNKFYKFIDEFLHYNPTFLYDEFDYDRLNLQILKKSILFASEIKKYLKYLPGSYCIDVVHNYPIQFTSNIKLVLKDHYGNIIKLYENTKELDFSF